MRDERTRHPNLKAFRQHGFVPHAPSGEKQVIGRCPFCGKRKFYINVDTKQWQCKVCSRSGGYQRFLESVLAFAQKNTNSGTLRKLGENRSLRPRTLARNGVAWHESAGTFLIPVWDADGTKLLDLRYYDGKYLRSTSGVHVGLFGSEKVREEHKTVWLCEGEWDKCAADEVIRKCALKDHVAVAVPGAGTFKPEWSNVFHDKTVLVIYDNDHDRKRNGETLEGAGKAGAKKVFRHLQYNARELKFIHWPNNTPDKFDLRDLYKRKKLKGKATYSWIKKHLQDLPPGFTEEEKKEQSEFNVKLNGEGLPHERIYKGYQKWFKIPKIHVLDVVYGSVLANRLPGDPLWMFLVAPSGFLKTELILSLSDAPLIYAISSLTPYTLISGAQSIGGGDPSLMPKLNHKVLTIKDFTTILEMKDTARDEIFGVLRDAYDGEASKPFGTGVMKKYKSKFGILAGVTPAIELYTQGHTALGERFLRFNVPMERSHESKRNITLKAIDNIRNKDKDRMRLELRALGTRALDYDFGEAPELTDKIVEPLLYTAQWVSIMRGTVVRDKYTREIIHRPFIEMPTRLATQLAKLLLGITLFRRKRSVGMDELGIVREVAVSTIPHNAERLMRKIWQTGQRGPFTLQDMSKMTTLPQGPTGRLAGDLAMLGVLRQKRQSRLFDTWYLDEEIQDIMKRGGIYK